MSKILLVEDDNNLREIYEARLQAEGYVIVSAKDGEEALVVAKSEKPDLIISDVMMPKISGFEMLDILRNTPELKATKVVMLTALGQAEDQNRASHLGADRYLVKSQVTLEDIVKTAHELLGDDDTQTPSEPMPPAAAAPDTNSGTAESPPAMEASVNPAPPVEQPAVPAPEPEAEKVPDMAPPAPEEMPTTPVAEDTPSGAPAPPPSESDAEITIDSSGQMGAPSVENKVTINPPVTEPAAQPTISTDNSTLDANQAANVETLTQAVNDLANESAPAPPIDPGADLSSNPNAVPGDNAIPDYSPANAISGKKIIKPIDQPPHRSLDELLAIEEATQPPPPAAAPEPVIMDPKGPFDPSDPNNIAL